MNLREIARPLRSPVPADFLDRATTLTQAVRELCERFPDFAGLTLLDRHRNEHVLTLGEFFARARAFQNALVSRGLAPGEAAVLILPTGFELVAAYFGVMLAGGVPAVAAVPGNRVSDPAVYRRTVGANRARARRG